MVNRWFVASTLAAIIVTTSATPGTAQVVVWKKGQKTIAETLEKPESKAQDGSTPQKIQLTGAVEPSPALKYRFWYPPVERQPGDVKSHVDRVIMMYLQHPQRKELDEKFKRLYEQMPDERTSEHQWTDHQLQEFRGYLHSQQDIVKQLHYALSLDTVRSDYALRNMRGSDLIAYNLADVQNARMLAWLLQTECQLAVAEGRYDDAIVSLRDGYRLGELTLHAGEGTIICQLVSVAIIGIMNGEVELMVQKKDCPNLYWALSSLPAEQLFSIRTAFEGESIGSLQSLFPWGATLPSSNETQAEQHLADLIKMATMYQNANPNADESKEAENHLLAAIAMVLFADRARTELEKPALGNCQAVLEWTHNEFVRLRDNAFKWMLLPVQERTRSQAQIDKSQQLFRSGIPDSPGAALFGLVIPAIQAADAAVQRTQRKHAFLITLEALRAYAAANKNELPESLEGLEPLPAWSDPTTGKPFTYRRTDAHHAVLITEKSTGLPNEFHIETTQP